MKKKLTQCEKVLNRLESGLPVNTVWANKNFITRLAARISDLKRQGYSIETEWRKGKNYIFYKLVDKV